MGFDHTNAGGRDTRVTVLKPIDPNAAQGYYDADGRLVNTNESQQKLWVRVVDRASIGPIIGGKIQDEVELGLMTDSRSARSVNIMDTLTTDRDGSTVIYQVVDLRDSNYRYETMILVRRTA